MAVCSILLMGRLIDELMGRLIGEFFGRGLDDRGPDSLLDLEINLRIVHRKLLYGLNVSEAFTPKGTGL
jgi:hypothetical protein